MKLSDLPTHVQARIKRDNPEAFALGGLPAAQPKYRGPRAAPPENGLQTVWPRSVVVSLVCCRRRLLDDDNLSGGCKALRDAIAASLGIDDGDKRIRFEYHQVITTGRPGVIVKIEVLPNRA